MDLKKLSKKKLEFLVEELIEMILDDNGKIPDEEERQQVWDELKERLKFKTPFRKLILKSRGRVK